jgi:hypothetical protein
MEPVHRMVVESDNGREALFVCPEPACGRRLVLQRGGRLVVLDRGDFYALHTGGTNGMQVSASL